jgi:hypothetical protein
MKPAPRQQMRGRVRLWKMIPAIALGIAVQGWKVTAQQPYYYSWSTDRTPVELQLYDNEQIVRLSIPRAYLHFSEDIKGGLHSSLSMYVIYPSMQPLSGTGKSMADDDILKIGLFSYHNTGAHFSVERSLKFRLENDLTRVDSDDSFDVYVRKEDVSKRNDKSALLTEFLVPKDKQFDQAVYFSCFRELGNLKVGCSGFVTFGNSIELDWIFRRGRLKEWPEMLSKVQGFVTSLVKN